MPHEQEVLIDPSPAAMGPNRAAAGDEPGDGQIVAEVLSGKRERYEVLYDRYARMVRAVCYDETRNVHEAQDLAQDVFLRAFDRLPQLRDADRFAAWLLTMTRNLCREWRRKKRPLPTDSAAVLEASGRDAQGGNVSELHAAMLRLPRRERLALHMFYLQQQPANRARELLGLSSAGFYKLLGRARERLAGLLRTTQE